MGAIVKVYISPCPECGHNEWWMDMPDATPDQVERARAVRLIQEARPTLGWFRWPFSWWGGRLGLNQSPGGDPDDDPPSETSVRCANCGHEMSFTQGSGPADEEKRWRIS